ncbi:hypothetical protein [Runella aurantiaca]|nr:hypothetical protein [Runella aurantiaca]
MKTIIPSKYEFFSKIFPTYIACLPLLLLFKSVSEYAKFLDELNNMGVVFFNVTIYLVISYFFVSVVRGFGKFLETNFFDSEKSFPTTNFLLYQNDEFSKRYKESIRNKISTDFGIQLLSETDEANDVNEAKNTIKDVVGLIRNKVGKGKLLLNYNIQYGFIRNLIGGSILGFIFSGINLIVLDNTSILYKITLWLMAFYILLTVAYKPILRFFSKLYAQRLYSEFLSL